MAGPAVESGAVRGRPNPHLDHPYPGHPMRPQPGTLLLALALTLVLTPWDARAQDPQSGDGAGWAPGTVGFRVGYDSNARGSMVGVQLTIPALPSGSVEVVPNADVTFLTGVRAYRAGVDLIAVIGGRRGGIYAGAGWGVRSAIYVAPARDTRDAPSVVLGAKTGVLRGAPFATQLEARWAFVDGPFDPRVLSLGVNFPLWGRPRR